MTKITADWLTAPETRAVCDMLTDAGHQAFFVGGCVRNALMNLPVTDLDMSTDAHPEHVVDLAEAAGLKAIPTGIEHGTITVVSGGRPYEITTFRKDVETDGRHATVAYSETIEEDAIRRDFTMNALYCAPDGTVRDPVDGLPDLHARRVRFINDPNERITEDYLRILRFFRFYAVYGDPGEGIDADGLAACAEHQDGLDGLATERIGAEVIKTLAARDPAPSLASMAASGVLARILPGADAGVLGPLVHLEQKAGVAPDPLTRLAGIYQGDGKDQLRLSNAQAATFERLRDCARGDMPANELGYRFGTQDAERCLILRAALLGFDVSDEDLVVARAADGMVFPITASDLTPAYEGKALGDRLKQLEATWISSGFTLSKAELLARP